MSEFKHTPEPWVSIENVNGFNVSIQGQGQSIAECWSLMGSRFISANATRIVECVNAMTGIESPLKLRETWDAVKHLELDAYHKAAERIEKLEAALRQIQADTSELHPAIANIAAKALEGGNDENS